MSSPTYDTTTSAGPTASATVVDKGVYLRPRQAKRWPVGVDGLEPPSPTDLLEARRVVSAYLAPTPLELSQPLSRRFGRSVYVKLENVSPIRSFKARGPLAALARMPAELRARGVVTSSTGNHGQGVALAGQQFGAPVTVVVPFKSEPVKLRAMETRGARILEHGANITESNVFARQLAEREGQTFLEDGEDPIIMAGAATAVWEMLETEPRLDTIVVPVGGGNLLAGSLLTAQLLQPGVAIVGAQSAAAPGATASWLAGEILDTECATAAGGIATTRPGPLAFMVGQQLLDRMVLVTEEDMWRAVGIAFDATGYPIDPAAGVALAALEEFGAEIPGERVGLLVTGGWIAITDLCRVAGLQAAR